MTMTEPTRSEQLAWAAGVFEGEGWIGRRAKHSAELVVGMTDEDVIQRFHEVVGCGAISVEWRKDGHKTLYRWHVARTSEVRVLLTAFLPWLGERRRRVALDVLAVLLENPGARALRTRCPQGHPYDDANTYWYDKDGYRSRHCMTCRRERARAQADARKTLRTHCPQGHLYDEANTDWYVKDGSWGRHCRACKQARAQKRT
jgi:hypothetical protein